MRPARAAGCATGAYGDFGVRDAISSAGGTFVTADQPSSMDAFAHIDVATEASERRETTSIQASGHLLPCCRSPH